MTTPPEQTSPPPSAPRSTMIPGDRASAAPMWRVPWTPELIIVAAAILLIAIISLFVEDVRGVHVVDAIMWLTAAYVISRGIAKASRVYEP